MKTETLLLGAAALFLLSQKKGGAAPGAGAAAEKPRIEGTGEGIVTNYQTAKLFGLDDGTQLLGMTKADVEQGAYRLLTATKGELVEVVDETWVRRETEAGVEYASKSGISVDTTPAEASEIRKAQQAAGGGFATPSWVSADPRA